MLNLICACSKWDEFCEVFCGRVNAFECTNAELCRRVIRAWRACIWAAHFFDEQQLVVAGPSVLETSADSRHSGPSGAHVQTVHNLLTIPQWPKVNCVGGSFAPCRVDMPLRRGGNQSHRVEDWNQNRRTVIFLTGIQTRETRTAFEVIPYDMDCWNLKWFRTCCTVSNDCKKILHMFNRNPGCHRPIPWSFSGTETSGQKGTMIMTTASIIKFKRPVQPATARNHGNGSKLLIHLGSLATAYLSINPVWGDFWSTSGCARCLGQRRVGGCFSVRHFTWL